MSYAFSDQPPGSVSQSCPLRRITVVLYDTLGEPVQGEEVKLCREGEEDKVATTDDEGKAVVEDITPGRWEVSFPQRLFDEWRRVERPSKPELWIDIALLDDEGEPVGGEPYKVIGPDGATVIENELGSDGRARVEVPSPGLCKVNFPQRAACDWWPLSEAAQRELRYRSSGPPSTIGRAESSGGSSGSGREAPPGGSHG